jgi:hypothetical protein
MKGAGIPVYGHSNVQNPLFVDTDKCIMLDFPKHIRYNDMRGIKHMAHLFTEDEIKLPEESLYVISVADILFVNNRHAIFSFIITKKLFVQ